MPTALSPGSAPLAKLRADLDASRHLLTAAGRSQQLATAGLTLSATLDTQHRTSIAQSAWAKGLVAQAKADREAFVKANRVRRLSEFDEYRKLTDTATTRGLVGQAATQYKAIEASNSMGLASQLAKIPKTFDAFPAADRIQKARMMGKYSPGIAVQPVTGIGGHESSLALGLATDKMPDISRLMTPVIAPGIRSLVEMSERTRPMYDMTAYRSALDRAVGAPTARAIRDAAAWTEPHGLDVEPTAAAMVLPVEESSHALPVALQYLWRYATTLNPNQCGTILQLFGYLLLLHNSGNVVGQVMTASGLVLGMAPTSEQMQR